MKKTTVFEAKSTVYNDAKNRIENDSILFCIYIVNMYDASEFTLVPFGDAENFDPSNYPYAWCFEVLFSEDGSEIDEIIHRVSKGPMLKKNELN